MPSIQRPCSYGSNLAKLRELKKKYDPDNFFRAERQYHASVTVKVGGWRWR